MFRLSKSAVSHGTSRSRVTTSNTRSRTNRAGGHTFRSVLGRLAEHIAIKQIGRQFDAGLENIKDLMEA